MPQLSLAARRMIAGNTISALGSGLTLPFTLILLHEVRHIALPTTGLLLAVPGVVGLAVVPVAGTLVDRLGARTVLRTALLLQVLASLMLAFVGSVPLVAVALVLQGAGLGPSFPAANALLAGLVRDPEHQSRAFALSFTLLNAGIGVATFAGGLIADVHRPGTFATLYCANAVATAGYAAMLPSGPARAERTVDESVVGYREVLADKTFRHLVLISLLLALIGYSAIDSGLPAFARVVAHVSPQTIALAFTVNTIIIVGGQLLVVRWLRGRRRTNALAGTAALWGLSWALLGALALLPPGTPRTVGVLVFGAVFGVGETLMAPVLSPLVNALASDRLRGRYNALSSSSVSVAFVVSPAISGLLIGVGLAGIWVVLLVAGAVATAATTRRVRSRLTDVEDGLVAEPVAA